MRAFSITAAALLLLSAGLAHAAEWQKDYSVTGTPEIRVDAKDGNVVVRTGAAGQVHARVITRNWRIGPDDVRIDEHQSGNNVEIDIHTPHTFCIGICNHELRLELEVPKDSTLDLKTGDGNMDVSDVSGEVTLRSGDGNLTINGTSGHLVAHSGDGNITMDSVTGTVQLESGDGNVRATGRFDALRVSTGDGNVTARAEDGSKLAEGWSLRSGDGNIELRLPEDLSAELDLRTGDGRITLDVPVTVSDSLSKHWIRGKLGQGGSLLEIQTGDGSIHLGR